MTGKEMESRSGVARANIRYYEAEGLLHPAREKNGYRDYSEADLEILEKIKLLRRLGVTIEELKALCAGKTELGSVLERRLTELKSERETMERVEQVCGELRASGETFATLDAPKYLKALDEGALTAPIILPERDKLPAVYSPWRRFFARSFDELLWGILLALVFCLAGKNPNLVEEQIGVLWTIMSVLLGFALEPLLISLTGTTPGKALLGMRLAAPEGRKLTLSEAYSRHFGMMWYGEGFYIPIWGLIQLWRSAKRGWNEEPQPWDAEVAYIAPPFEGKFVAFMAAAAAVLLVAVSVGGTVAFLQDRTQEIVNTFTTSNIDITLEESKNLDLKMVPGKELRKDPTVTVIKGSEACWLFVEVEKTEGFDTYLTYEMAAGWTLVPGETNVYYREVAAVTADTEFPVIKDNKVTVTTNETLTNAKMDELEGDKNPKMTITAYAIQKVNFADAATAWAEVSKLNTTAEHYVTPSTSEEGTTVTTSAGEGE